VFGRLFVVHDGGGGRRVVERGCEGLAIGVAAHHHHGVTVVARRSPLQKPIGPASKPRWSRYEQQTTSDNSKPAAAPAATSSAAGLALPLCRAHDEAREVAKWLQCEARKEPLVAACSGRLTFGLVFGVSLKNKWNIPAYNKGHEHKTTPANDNEPIIARTLRVNLSSGANPILAPVN